MKIALPGGRRGVVPRGSAEARVCLRLPHMARGRAGPRRACQDHKIGRRAARPNRENPYDHAARLAGNGSAKNCIQQNKYLCANTPQPSRLPPAVDAPSRQKELNLFPATIKCPRCKVGACYPLHRKRLDWSISLLGLRPVRCLTCARKFYRRYSLTDAAALGRSLATAGDEQRRAA